VSLGTALAIALGFAFSFLVLQLGHFDEKRRFAAVEPGMTEDEVLRVMGMPPGQYGPAGARYAVWCG
jgi:outer membrane protein assembly factor BamE (lipoprotein component of BamABCDE complex)